MVKNGELWLSGVYKILKVLEVKAGGCYLVMSWSLSRPLKPTCKTTTLVSSIRLALPMKIQWRLLKYVESMLQWLPFLWNIGSIDTKTIEMTIIVFVYITLPFFCLQFSLLTSMLIFISFTTLKLKILGLWR